MINKMICEILSLKTKLPNQLKYEYSICIIEFRTLMVIEHEDLLS